MKAIAIALIIYSNTVISITAVTSQETDWKEIRTTGHIVITDDKLMIKTERYRYEGDILSITDARGTKIVRTSNSSLYIRGNSIQWVQPNTEIVKFYRNYKIKQK